MQKTLTDLFKKVGALLGQPATRPPELSAQSPESLLENLQRLNTLIEQCYQQLRQPDHPAEAEERFLAQIRLLEDFRFQLLDQLNGQDVLKYNTLPLRVV